MKDSNNLISTLFDQQIINISVTDFIINIVLTALMSYLLGLIYTKYGGSLSNRKMLSTTLLLISITTMLIITIVKSSLALSLGLVGALSIVRFRTAIKEPEELAYFFISIAIGLGMGAGERLITLVGIVMIFFVIFLKKRKNKEDHLQNLILTIHPSGNKDGEVQLAEITKVLQANCASVELRRLDESPTYTEVAFSIEIKNFDSLLQTRKELQGVQPNLNFNFLENNRG